MRPASAGENSAEVERLGDRDVEEVVDHRRRAIGAVVRDADRVVLLRLDHEGHARREHEVVEVVEAIDARAGDQAELVRAGRSRPGCSRPLRCGCRPSGAIDRSKRVEAQVAAVGDDVLVLDGLDVRRLEVERLGQEVEADRLARSGSTDSRFAASPFRMLVKKPAWNPLLVKFTLP